MSNNPYGCKGKPEGPRDDKSLHERKHLEGISRDMTAVVDDERYGKNLMYLRARYGEISRTKEKEYASAYAQKEMKVAI